MNIKSSTTKILTVLFLVSILIGIQTVSAAISNTGMGNSVKITFIDGNKTNETSETIHLNNFNIRIKESFTSNFNGGIQEVKPIVAVINNPITTEPTEVIEEEKRSNLFKYTMLTLLILGIIFVSVIGFYYIWAYVEEQNGSWWIKRFKV